MRESGWKTGTASPLMRTWHSEECYICRSLPLCRWIGALVWWCEERFNFVKLVVLLFEHLQLFEELPRGEAETRRIAGLAAGSYGVVG